MSKFHAAIFDMDGTLLDTMFIWENLCSEFLRQRGVAAPADLSETVGLLSVRRAAIFLTENFPLGLNADGAVKYMDTMIRRAYLEHGSFKPGALEFLTGLRKRGVATAILSATGSDHVIAVMEKLGALELFSGGVMSGEDLKTSKKHPELFWQMAEKLGSEPGETIVFEDALYAGTTAKKAGFKLCGVYDASETATEKLAGIADWYIRDFRDFPVEIFD